MFLIKQLTIQIRQLCLEKNCCLFLFIFRLFYSEFKRHYDDTGGEEMLAFLEKMVQEFNDKHNAVCVKVDSTQAAEPLIVICSPLMQRFHSMWRYSKEMVFVNSSGNMDR